MSILDVDCQVKIMTEEELINSFKKTTKYEEMYFWFRKWISACSCDEQSMIHDVVRMSSFGYYYKEHSKNDFGIFDLELFVKSIINKYK